MRAFTCATCAHYHPYECRLHPPVVVLNRAESEQGNVGQSVTAYEPQSVFPTVDENDFCGQWTSKEMLRQKRLAQLPKYGDGDVEEK